MVNKATKVLYVLLRILYGILVIPAAYIALFSFMMYDDSRAINNMYVHLFVISVASLPISLGLAISQSTKDARFFLLPILNVLLFLISTIGLGWYAHP